jgi:hypothetical protein
MILMVLVMLYTEVCLILADPPENCLGAPQLEILDLMTEILILVLRSYLNCLNRNYYLHYFVNHQPVRSPSNYFPTSLPSSAVAREAHHASSDLQNNFKNK